MQSKTITFGRNRVLSLLAVSAALAAVPAVAPTGVDGFGLTDAHACIIVDGLPIGCDEDPVPPGQPIPCADHGFINGTQACNHPISLPYDPNHVPATPEERPDSPRPGGPTRR